MQSSASLQHLPYNKELETELPAELVSRLSFAKQKLGEIVAAAKGAKPSSGSLTSALPSVRARPLLYVGLVAFFRNDSLSCYCASLLSQSSAISHRLLAGECLSLASPSCLLPGRACIFLHHEPPDPCRSNSDQMCRNGAATWEVRAVGHLK